MIDLEKEFPRKHYSVVFYKNREKEESDGTLLFDTSDSSDFKRCQTKVDLKEVFENTKLLIKAWGKINLCLLHWSEASPVFMIQDDPNAANEKANKNR